MATAAQGVPTRTAFRVKASSVEACSCEHGCNCQFAGFPNEGICEFIIGYEVTDGHFGEVDLNGLRAVVAGRYPNAIHEGNGHVVLFVDENARQEQVDAFATILSGQLGGMPWEALAGTISRFEGPIRKPIGIHHNGSRSRVEVPGVIELQTAPLYNPVTNEENEVHIVYPRGGFFWNEAHVVTTDTMRVDFGDMKMDWPARYGSMAEVNWSNQT